MKTDNKIPLKNGYLTFLRDRLEISDNSRLEKIFILIGFFSSSLYGLSCVISYSSAEGAIMYYSGVMILITWVLAIPLLINRTYRHVLYYNDISKINMQENIGGDYKAKFKLKKGKIRFVHLKKNRENAALFIRKLNEFKLKTEFQPLLT
jgi:hypothetical protein